MNIFRSRPKKSRLHHIVLFGKDGCHLCEEARELLIELERSYRFMLEEVDIQSDPVLFRRYDVRIPVLLIDRSLEVDAPVTREKVESALRKSPGIES